MNLSLTIKNLQETFVKFILIYLFCISSDILVRMFFTLYLYKRIDYDVCTIFYAV